MTAPVHCTPGVKQIWHDQTPISKRPLSGAITSMLYIFLHSADKYGLLDQATSGVWLFLFSLAHAVPLTLVGVSYMFLFHAHTRQLEEETRRGAHKCPVCGKGFPTQSALDGHSRIHKP